jgi:acetyltransferase-like isoleucine patch superfamily enzyme
MFQKLRIFIKKVLYYFLNTTENNEKVVFSGYSSGIQNVTFEGKNAVPDRCNFSGKIKIGFATTLGQNNFFAGDINIGKYCQIGADVAIHTTNHPVSYMSTYINKNLFNGELVTLKENNKTIIGNDVWIGHNVIILGNVKIGNGAILAAGSIVTKDIAPYSIVAGVPAKQIKKRFSDEIIKEIEALKWWDLTHPELEKIKSFFFKDFQNKESIYE